MLRCIRKPTIGYQLTALAEDSCVSVGREMDAHIQLDSIDIPCLLSRKHANLVLQPDGTVTVVDLGSTNGTFAARQNQPLRKLPPGYAWELQHGDTIGFGGPETIIVKRAQVGNPFLFVYYSTAGSTDESACQAQLPCVEMSSGTPKIDQQQHSEQPAVHHMSDNQTLERARRGPDDPVHDSRHRDQVSQHNALTCRSPGSARAGNIKTWSQGQLSTPRNYKKAAEVAHNHLLCPVCCDTLLATHMLHCGHMFCGTCLATWMTQNQSCPSCRKVIAGVPVRCFTIDNMISELLGAQLMSPGVRTERKRKQEHWDNIQRMVVHDWVTMMQRRRETAQQGPVRYNIELQPHAPGSVPVMAGPRPAVDGNGRVVHSMGSVTGTAFPPHGMFTVPVPPSVDSDATAQFTFGGVVSASHNTH